ncbi:hypothetical protein [Clostridium sp.]|uniref:hypothetical protein n=1 Tax=Clostridium sp. TaxID=1506 RepID=UPI00261C46CE|nr:hypothetical protein [Clostridium sp.]
MLDFLLGKDYSEENFEGEINGFNEETKKFIVNGVDNNDNEKTIEIDIFKSGIIQNIDYYEGWQEKLYTGLIRNNGKISIHVLSTESADSWFLEIYRNKTLLPTHEYSDQIVLINYVIVFCNEIKGDIFTKREMKYSGFGIDDKKDFSKWIEEEIEKVGEFNNTNCWQTPCEAIIVSESLNTKEDYILLHQLFSNTWYPKAD